MPQPIISTSQSERSQGDMEWKWWKEALAKEYTSKKAEKEAELFKLIDRKRKLIKAFGI
jgi:hypothetical protein